MAYCNNCGAQIDDKAVICPFCGVEQKNAVVGTDSGSILWGALGFCIPLVGLILFLVWKDSKPKTAKIAGKGALISVIIGILFYVVMFIIGVMGAMAGV